MPLSLTDYAEKAALTVGTEMRTICRYLNWGRDKKGVEYEKDDDFRMRVHGVFCGSRGSGPGSPRDVA